VTTALRPPPCDHSAYGDDPLGPVTSTLRAMFGTSTAIPGLAPDLVVYDTDRWTPADALTGDRLDDLLDASRRRWQAQPHAAGALAWKWYTYWLALPAVLGWAAARRVPLLTAKTVLTHFDDPRPLVTFGLRPDFTVAVLPTDPIAAGGDPRVRVVADEAALLAELRRSLLDEHLTPLLGSLHKRSRLGSRPLMGTLATVVANAVLRSENLTAGESPENIALLLGALGVEDLIDLVPAGAGRLEVQRKTCCLAFTLPRPKVCRGCCIKQ
jgi:hypothetical protein